MSTVHPLTDEDVRTLERCMRAGGVAVVPTDTVYGLACDPDLGDAFTRLWRMKRRDPRKPSALLFSRVELALAATPWLSDETRAAVARLLPGPVTVVVENPHGRFPAACGQHPERLGLRVPRWSDATAALVGLSWPILQTSANPSGQTEAATAQLVAGELRDEVDLILDAGALPGTPSTVVDLSGYHADGSWKVLREGAVDGPTLTRLLDR